MIATTRRNVATPLGHSAEVQLYLHTNNQTIRLAQVGSDALKPFDGGVIPTGLSKLEVVVDGTSYTRMVLVPRAGVPGAWAQLDTTAVPNSVFTPSSPLPAS